MVNLPLPEEPKRPQVSGARADAAVAGDGLPLVVAGTWIADPLWELWGEELKRHGMERERFGQIVAEFGNELRLWVVGERPGQQYISGLAGRVTRRLSPCPHGSSRRRPAARSTPRGKSRSAGSAFESRRRSSVPDLAHR